MIVDWFVYGAILYGISRLLRATVFRENPPSNFLRWVITAVVFIVSLIALSALKVLRYQVISDGTGLEIAPRSPIDLTGAILFAWMFFTWLKAGTSKFASANQSYPPPLPGELQSLRTASNIETVKAEQNAAADTAETGSQTIEDNPVRMQIIEAPDFRTPQLVDTVQRKVLIGISLTLALMLLFPPFHFVNAAGVQMNLGFGWLFAPPEWRGYTGSINIQQLLLQWFGVVVIGAILFVLSGRKPLPEFLTAYILDPGKGLDTRVWRVGTDITTDLAQKYSVDGSIYVAVVYQEGIPSFVVGPKSLWEKTLRAFQSIDNVR